MCASDLRAPHTCDSSFDAAARTIQRILSRELDPISLRPIRIRFALFRNGVLIAYDAHTLIEYITLSGDIRDPIARQELATHERMRLERVGRLALPSFEELRKLHDEIVSVRYLATFIDQEVSELREQARMASSATPSSGGGGGARNEGRGEWRLMRFSLSNYFHNSQHGEMYAPDMDVATANALLNDTSSSSDASFISSMRAPPPIRRSSGYTLPHRRFRTLSSPPTHRTLWERRRRAWVHEHMTITTVATVEHE